MYTFSLILRSAVRSSLLVRNSTIDVTLTCIIRCILITVVCCILITVMSINHNHSGPNCSAQAAVLGTCFKS